MPPAPLFDPKAFSVTDALATSIIILNQHALVVWCNTAAEMLLGSSRRNLNGTDIGLLLPEVSEWISRIGKSETKFAPFNALTELRRPMADSEHVLASISNIGSGDDFLVLEIAQVQNALDITRQQQEAGMTDATKVLLRNLAHEVKNPLGGIRGAAQLLELELATSEQREYTEVIIAEADRLQQLVDRLLAPYRRERRIAEVNVHEVLERVRQLVLVEFPVGLEIERDYDVSAPSVMGDAEQLIQIFLNLLRNAAEATALQQESGGARVVLRTRIARQVMIRGRRYRLALNVHVVDNGPGIDPVLREKIFYPLVTGRDSGTGLGLSIVQTYVEQHEGSIEVTSEPGCTDFSVLIPLSESI